MFPQGKRASAEWVEEAPSFSGQIALLANFGSTGFSNCTYNNGQSPSGGGFLNMVDTSGTPEDQVSPLSGNSFSVQWVNCH